MMGECWWFSGIPCVLRTRPLRCAKGREMASAGMTWGVLR